MRIRRTLALVLGTLTCLAPLAAAKPKTKAKAKPKAPAGDAKPVDMGDTPLPGDAPAPAPTPAPAKGAGAATGAGATVNGSASGSGNAGTAVEMTDDDKPSEDPTGTKENPNAPHVGDDDAPTGVASTAPAPRPTGYPIQEVLRPITLPQSTSEVAIDLRSTFDHADAEGVLRARYGITRQVQVGLIYDIGGVFSDAAPMPSNKFNTGKAAGVEGSYLLADWVALHVRVPLYMQPFAMGITLGAPMKFRIGDRVALTALDNVVDITVVNKFTPNLDSEAANRAAATESTANPVRHDGNLRFVGGATYQVNDKTALSGATGFFIPDFGNGTSATYMLEGVLQWSPSAKIDIAGRLGIDSLADAASTFGVRFTAAFRI